MSSDLFSPQPIGSPSGASVEQRLHVVEGLLRDVLGRLSAVQDDPVAGRRGRVSGSGVRGRANSQGVRGGTSRSYRGYYGFPRVD